MSSDRTGGRWFQVLTCAVESELLQYHWGRRHVLLSPARPEPLWQLRGQDACILYGKAGGFRGSDAVMIGDCGCYTG